MSLDLDLAPIFQKLQILPVGTVDGLLCLWQFDKGKDNTYICNPITREYMILPSKQGYGEGQIPSVEGFGVGSVTKEYKVIRIFYPRSFTLTSQPDVLEAEVYTLGTGQWRSLGHIPYWLNGFSGPFLNGHAHWTVIDKDSPEKLCAFDFDNETFKLFPSPPVETIQKSERHFETLRVLKGCLCQYETFDSQSTIWVMKEYGIKTSWYKEVIITQGISPDLDLLTWKPVHLIEHLHDGTILMVYYRENCRPIVLRGKQLKTLRFSTAHSVEWLIALAFLSSRMLNQKAFMGSKGQ